MFVYPGDVIPVDEWERMKAEAYNRCMAERSDAGLAPMVEATGIDWFEPGIPDKLPPTPGERVGGYMHAVNQLPRRLRRHAQRILHCDDVCGAMEVMGYLSDAELEANITGEDRSTTYLEYLYEIPYAIPVLRFIAAVHDWLTGLDRFEFIRAWVTELYALGLTDDSPETFLALHPVDTHQRPPPLRLRPCITADGPPAPFGRHSGPALRATA
jgi:hypothetical protein